MVASASLAAILVGSEIEIDAASQSSAATAQPAAQTIAKSSVEAIRTLPPPQITVST